MSKSKYWSIKQNLMRQVFLFAAYKPDLLHSPVRLFADYFQACCGVDNGKLNGRVLALKHFLSAIEIDPSEIQQEDLESFRQFLATYKGQPKAVRALNVVEAIKQQEGWEPEDGRDGWLSKGDLPPQF